MLETREQLEELLKNGVSDIEAAAEIADKDPMRPRYHFHSPSQWMDDPNGIIYHKGYYHMMYSLNPNTSKHRAGMVYKTAHRVWDPGHEDWTGGITVWGHARSKDMVHWEHLPIALYPVLEKGEHFIWFGTTALNENGTPIAVYTSVGPDKRPEDTADQWLWFGDDDLIKWKPAEDNPILDYDLHGDERLTEWRDPFVVKHDGKGYLILGARRVGKEKNDAVIALYEAQNPEYTKWSYKGVIFSLENREVPSCECPNLVKIQDKWVILVSPHGAVEYYVGNMDFEHAQFTVESSGMVDFSTNFYATNVLEDDRERKIMWGAVEGFCNTKGWNGCVSLPRQLSVSRDGHLWQGPVKELESLRNDHTAFSGVVTGDKSQKLFDIREGTAEIKLWVRSGSAVRLILPPGPAGEIRIGSDFVSAGTKKAPLKKKDEHELTIFLDRTVIEMFLDDGTCLTSVLPQAITKGTVEVVAEGGPAEVKADAYNLHCADLFSMELFR